MYKKIALILVTVVLGVGMAYSVWDYRKWQWEETKNYGHGPGEQFVAAEQLTKRYENSGMGVRLGYPSNWTIAENQNLVVMEKGRPLTWRELVGVNTQERIVTLRMEDELAIEINLKRLAAAGTYDLEDEVGRIKSEGVEFVSEREYINTDRENWMILAWEEGEKQIREAITIKGERLVAIRMVCSKKLVKRWKLTEEEVVRSVKIF